MINLITLISPQSQILDIKKIKTGITVVTIKKNQ